MFYILSFSVIYKLIHHLLPTPHEHVGPSVTQQKCILSAMPLYNSSKIVRNHQLISDKRCDTRGKNSLVIEQFWISVIHFATFLYTVSFCIITFVGDTLLKHSSILLLKHCFVLHFCRSFSQFILLNVYMCFNTTEFDIPVNFVKI